MIDMHPQKLTVSISCIKEMTQPELDAFIRCLQTSRRWLKREASRRAAATDADRKERE